MINICCCLRLKSKKASELSQKRSLNGSTGVIGYADSEYVTVEPRELGHPRSLKWGSWPEIFKIHLLFSYELFFGLLVVPKQYLEVPL